MDDGARIQPEVTIESTGGRLGPYLRELPRHRGLLAFLVWKNLKVQYAQTALGFGWLLLRPLLHAAILTAIFSALARLPSDGVPYPLFALTGLLGWLYFSGVVGRSAGALQSNKALITKVYFPRLFLPLSQVLVGLAEFVATLLVVLAIAAVYGYRPGLHLLWLPVPLALLLAVTTGTSIWLSALVVRFPDTRQMVGQILQLLMFAAPVIWPLSMLSSRLHIDGTALLAYALYPLVGVIEGFRHCLLGSGTMPWALLGMGAVTATLLVATGLEYFRRSDRELADLV